MMMMMMFTIEMNKEFNVSNISVNMFRIFKSLNVSAFMMNLVCQLNFCIIKIYLIYFRRKFFSLFTYSSAFDLLPSDGLLSCELEMFSVGFEVGENFISFNACKQKIFQTLVNSHIYI